MFTKSLWCMALLSTASLFSSQQPPALEPKHTSVRGARRYLDAEVRRQGVVLALADTRQMLCAQFTKAYTMQANRTANLTMEQRMEARLSAEARGRLDGLMAYIALMESPDMPREWVHTNNVLRSRELVLQAGALYHMPLKTSSNAAQ